MIYVGAPYTDKSEEIMQLRYEAILRYCARMMQSQIVVFSPVVHCHEMARLYAMPRDSTFWKFYNAAMLRRATDFHYLMLPNWENSDGLRWELTVCEVINIPRVGIEWELD